MSETNATNIFHYKYVTDYSDIQSNYNFCKYFRKDPTWHQILLYSEQSPTSTTDVGKDRFVSNSQQKRM